MSSPTGEGLQSFFFILKYYMKSKVRVTRASLFGKYVWMVHFVLSTMRTRCCCAPCREGISFLMGSHWTLPLSALEWRGQLGQQWEQPWCRWLMASARLLREWKVWSAIPEIIRKMSGQNARWAGERFWTPGKIGCERNEIAGAWYVLEMNGVPTWLKLE